VSRIVALLVAGAAVTAQAEPATYTFDPTHTSAHFEVSHFGTSTLHGRFDRKQGSVVVDRAAHTGRIEVTIEVASVSTGVPAFDRRLQEPDLLDGARFSEARFVGDRLVFDGDRLAEVGGELTIAGRSNPVVLKAIRFDCYTSPLFKREVCGGDFEATLQRSQWGLAGGWPGTETVRLLIQAEAVRQP
jgi:polyisoprenoid-binding protein YceI